MENWDYLGQKSLFRKLFLATQKDGLVNSRPLNALAFTLREYHWEFGDESQGPQDLIREIINSVIVCILCLENDLVDEFGNNPEISFKGSSFRDYVAKMIEANSINDVSLHIRDDHRQEFIGDAQLVADGFDIKLK